MLADQYQRRLLDARERLDHAVVELREHPARGVGQAGRGAMRRNPHLLRPAQRIKSLRLQRLGSGNGKVRVPALAPARVVVAGARVEQHQRTRPLGMHEVERERHVPAERKARDDRVIRALGVEDRRHVGDGLRLAVAGGVLRAGSLPVPAHVPGDHAVVLGQRRQLPCPHLGGRAVAVAEQNRRALALRLVEDLDTVSLNRGHPLPPALSLLHSLQDRRALPSAMPALPSCPRALSRHSCAGRNPCDLPTSPATSIHSTAHQPTRTRLPTDGAPPTPSLRAPEPARSEAPMTSPTAREPIGSEIVFDLPSVSSPALSPDGDTVAYVHAQVSRETMSGESHIRAVAFDGGDDRRLTAGPRDGSPAWSPDGSQLAFLRAADADAPRQLWLLPISGGEAQRLTDLPYQVESCVWLPDGQRPDRGRRCRPRASHRGRRRTAHHRAARGLLPRRHARLPRRRLASPLQHRREQRRRHSAHQRSLQQRTPRHLARRPLGRVQLRPLGGARPPAPVRQRTLRDAQPAAA